MKTIRERLTMLPEPYRTQAISNHEKYGVPHYDPIGDDGTMEGAIRYGFTWRLSAEGEPYWRKVYDMFHRLRKL